MPINYPPGGSGTVTSVATTAPITGGTITGTGTVGITNFVASGASAAAGAVPAPSTTPGSTKFLREDATWSVPSGGGGGGGSVTAYSTYTSAETTISGAVSGYWAETNSAPTYASGWLIASLTITAASNTQQILFNLDAQFNESVEVNQVHFGLYKGTSLIALFGSIASDLPTAVGVGLLSFSGNFMYTPGDTSADTYNFVAIPGGSNYIYINGSNTGGSLASALPKSGMSAIMIGS
jgi:hypothetical protein